MLKARLSDHRGYINNKVVNITTGDHFNQPGHSLADLNVLIVEQVKIEDDNYRKERERYFINKFNTFYDGINRETSRESQNTAQRTSHPLFRCQVVLTKRLF